MQDPTNAADGNVADLEEFNFGGGDDPGTIGDDDSQGGTPASVADPQGGEVTPDDGNLDAGGEPQQPKDDPGRFEYWQSRHDKVAAKMEQIEPYLPMVQYLSQNPQVVQELEQQLHSGSRPAPVAEPQGLQPPKAPEKPQRPENYDAAAAESDPSSDSFKYRQALESYRDKQFQYLIERDQYRETVEQQRAQQYEAMQQKRTALARVQSELQVKHGLKPAEAQDFLRVMSDDRQLNLANLVKLYRVITAQQRPTNPNNRPSGNLGPIPPALGGSQGEPVQDAQAEFNESLMAYKRK